MDTYTSFKNYTDEVLEKANGMRMWAANGYDGIGIRTDEDSVIDGISNLFAGSILDCESIEDITEGKQCALRTQIIIKGNIIHIQLAPSYRISDVQQDLKNNRVYFTVKEMRGGKQNGK